MFTHYYVRTYFQVSYLRRQNYFLHPAVCGHFYHRGPSSRGRDSSPSNHNCSSPDQHGRDEGEENNSSSNNNNNKDLKDPAGDRSRKISVFNVGRVFSNLMMGRNSMPPELPSSQRRAESRSTDRLSLKKVFKKRSV